MSKSVLLGVAAMVCIGAVSPAMAAAPDPAGAPKAAGSEVGTAPTATDKVRYCVVETLTGSHLRTKTCHTRKEWLAQGFDPLQK